MAVPIIMSDLSVSEGSNVPLDSESITPTTRPSDYLRAHAAILRSLAASTTIAAGITTDLSTVTGTFVTLTGVVVNGITGLGTLAAGIYKFVIYNDAHTLTNSATLILLGGANRTVAAGDISLFVSEGAGTWREVMFSDATGYQPLDAELTAIAGLAVTDGNIIVGNGTTWVAESGATARASLGIISATDAAEGLIELATSAEVSAGTDTTRAITPAGLAAGRIVSGTAIATTSGTTHDFTGIPSWVKRITLTLTGVSTNGTSIPIIQIGDSGGFATVAYSSTASAMQSSAVTTVAFSTGFGMSDSQSAAYSIYGSVVLVKHETTNTWIAHSRINQDTTRQAVGGGARTLALALTQVRLTTVNGTDAFDAGSFNMLYE